MNKENALYIILSEKIKNGSLVLPTLPEVALKVREASNDPEVNLAKMSEVIKQDPSLSLGILKVANSAYLSRNVNVETVNQAVTRIGLRQIKSIATAIAIEQMFVSDNDIVKTYMDKSWQKTVDVASVAIALMNNYLKTHKHEALSFEVITLAALVHNIGVLPILFEAENHSDVFANPTFLEQAITSLSSTIGAEVTQEWGFSGELTEIVKSWNDMSVVPKEAHYIDFIRAGAIHHGVFKSENNCRVLINSFVKKEILPSADFMSSDEFAEDVADIKTMFS